MTNRKLHMRFQLAPRSMTLDDVELENSLFSSFRRQYLAKRKQYTSLSRSLPLRLVSFREGFSAANAGWKLGRVETSSADPLWPVERALYQEEPVCRSPLRPRHSSGAQWPHYHRSSHRPLSISHPWFCTYQLRVPTVNWITIRNLSPPALLHDTKCYLSMLKLILSDR